jgi:hypothetical protein
MMLKQDETSPEQVTYVIHVLAYEHDLLAAVPEVAVGVEIVMDDLALRRVSRPVALWQGCPPAQQTISHIHLQFWHGELQRAAYLP